MELKDQVCTESQGLRLEELGVKLTPLFAYCWITLTNEESVKEILLTDDKNTRIPDMATTWIAPAYTASELLDFLPVNTSVTKGGKQYHCRHWWGDPLSGVLREEVKGSSSSSWHQTTADNPAKACADMLIFLLENKLVTQ